MSIITEVSYLERIEGFVDENEDVGHFASLNLHFDCPDFTIKKFIACLTNLRYQELRNSL